MLSRQVDGPARMAYAHFAVERPRHFILIGTTNNSTYLTDSTGGRRFWPIDVQRFDIEWIREHRDQLWAEACAREAAGASIRLHENLWPEATEQQEKRREVDPWEIVIRRKLMDGDKGSYSDGRIRVVTSALWDAIGIPIERRDRMGQIRISEIMQRLGFKRTRVRPHGEEVQVGFVQDRNVIELREEGEREPGEDDVPI
jgi:predicted P-loop ATPase